MSLAVGTRLTKDEAGIVIRTREISGSIFCFGLSYEVVKHVTIRPVAVSLYRIALSLSLKKGPVPGKAQGK